MNDYKKHAGFTLIEVLIAMVIMAIGLLGLAGLQASSLKQNQSAYYRTQAMQLAYDLADRMRSNVVESKKYTASKYITVQPASADKNKCTSNCNPAQLAERDLGEWNDAVTNNLPGAQGTIAFTVPTYTISITWDDDRDGDSNNNPSFQMSIQL